MRRYARYKPTGIPWLPEVPEGWEMVRNKTFLSLTDEKVGARKDEFTLLSLTKQGVIVRDLTEMKGKFPKDFDTYLVVRPGNLVFCLFDVDETPRTVGLVKNVGMLTGAYTNFNVDASRVLPDFACYYYLHVDDAKKLRPYYTGLRKVVKTNTFLQLRFPQPSLPVQRAIVSFLDSKCGKIDRLVAAKEKEVALLKELKQSMIAEAVTGRTSNRPMKPSGIPWLPELPEGWEVKRARYLFKKEQRPTRPGDEIVTAFRDGQVTLRKNRRVTGFTEATDYSHYQGVHKGDLVIHQMDAFAGCAGVSDSDGMGTPVLSVCTPLSSDVDVMYYAHIVRLMGRNGFIQSLARGIRERSADFRFETFARQYLPLPPLSEQREIVAYIEARAAKIDAAVSKLEAEVAALKEYRERLVADVVTGQRKVA